eukprot:TRINITY_DN15384_c0_g1_i1.p1 TRINITY_DN15384_c0_g1~~TRINITY_DN15384_c0_g1_i1.p1  ORF type:complete len:560 (+),score=137.39 TRINITY_DN15384_c0_g1_i1:24-1682(+)
MAQDDEEEYLAAIAASLASLEEDKKKRENQYGGLSTSKEFIPKFLAEVADVSGVNYFLTVPNELTILVFTFLGLKDLMKISLVCKIWNSLAEDDSLWKPIYKKKYILHYPFINNRPNTTQKSNVSQDDAIKTLKKLVMSPVEVKQEFSKNLFQSESVQHLLNDPSSSSSTTSSNSSTSNSTTNNKWKTKYTSRQNWQFSTPFSSQVIPPTQNPPPATILSLFSIPSPFPNFPNSSAPSLLTLTSFSLRLNNNNLLTPSSPTSYYTLMANSPDLLFTTTHKTLDVYNPQQGKVVDSAPIDNKPTTINYSVVHNRLIVRTIALSWSIFDISPTGVVPIYTAYTGALATSCFLHNNMMIVGYNNRKIKAYDMRTGGKIRNMYGHNSTVVSIDVDTQGGSHKTVSAGRNGDVRVWDVRGASTPGGFILAGATVALEKSMDVREKTSCVKWCAGGGQEAFVVGAENGVHLYSVAGVNGASTNKSSGYGFSNSSSDPSSWWFESSTANTNSPKDKSGKNSGEGKRLEGGKGKRVTSMDVDDNRIVAGCIDGSILVYNF